MKGQIENVDLESFYCSETPSQFTILLLLS